MTVDSEPTWEQVANADDLASAGRLVVTVRDVPVLLLWIDGAPAAMNDTCIHRGRSLSEGARLGRRLVCAGHQWAFDLTTGYCQARDRYQPVHQVRVRDDVVEIDSSTVTPTVQVGPIAPPTDGARLAPTSSAG
ncbi:MAG TPA: Rieske 2Fe-2S domain-containing protein [Mycobacteriales bacterium]|jgi:nitrite reductase (NADH) small subunit|nr:Rieske 2Fe-2S domain-containing protein [Mycobacteriales bacterium]